MQSGMMGMKRVALFTFVWLMGFASVGLAQRQDTIYQTLATNYISANANGDTWGPVTNIGQAFHQAYLNIVPQIGKTCNSGSTGTSTISNVVFITQYPGQAVQPVQNYSYAYNSITPTGFTNGVALQENISGVVNHPFVYLKVSGIDIANCQYTLIYTGSLYPGNLQNPGNQSPSLYFRIPTSGATALFNSLSGYFNQKIYSLVLSNATAGQTVTFACGAGTLMIFDNLIAGQIITLPTIDSNVGYFICPGDPHNLTITLANSTPVDFIIRVAVE